MRPSISSVRISTQPHAGIRLSFALLACLAVLTHPLHSQPASPQEKPMKHYALLFHTSRTLTPEEQKQRGVEIAAWVERVTNMGVTLDPRSLGETAANFAAKGTEIISGNGSIDPSLSTIVFFDSPSRDQAVDIARIHPGLHYGVTVEVREWTSPRQASSQQPAARP
jgi:hypothetical protein